MKTEELNHVRCELLDDRQIALITIENGPYNVLSNQVAKEIQAVFQRLEERNTIRCAIVTGHGEKAFLAGADIKEFSRVTAEDARAHMRVFQESFQAVASAPFPVIACVNGLALGGGCELALCCDIRLGAASAKIGLPEVNLGVIPSAGGTQRLARVVGEGRAKELLLTGEAVTAQRAYEIGLYNQVYESQSLLAEALKLARKIAAAAPLAVSRAKQAMADGADVTAAEALQIETELGASCFSTRDLREGIDAFMAKRPPVFQGN